MSLTTHTEAAAITSALQQVVDDAGPLRLPAPLLLKDVQYLGQLLRTFYPTGPPKLWCILPSSQLLLQSTLPAIPLLVNSFQILSFFFSTSY